MRKNLPCFAGRPQQSGVSVIAAIFLLMLMASLAAFMVNLVSVTSANLAADVGGSRAYQAARAGVEWAMFQLDPNAQAAALPTCAAAAGVLNIIPNHTVTVTCTPFPSDATVYTEGSKTIRIFRLVAVARATNVKPPIIERQVEVTVEKCRDTTITAPPYDC